MVIPLVFLAAGLVVEDRRAIRTVVAITAVALLFIDRSCILESMSRTWTSFDESKRSGGPLAFGSNQTAAFLAQFAMFFWGFAQYVNRKKIQNLRLFTCGCHLVRHYVHVLSWWLSRSSLRRSGSWLYKGSKTTSGSWRVPVDLANRRACSSSGACQYDSNFQRRTRSICPGACRAMAKCRTIDPP